MSEASRAHRQRLINRLEELNRKYGPVEETEPDARDLPPSWGPVGSLARRTMEPFAFAHLLKVDADLHDQERSRKVPQAADVPDPPSPRPAGVEPEVWQRPAL